MMKSFSPQFFVLIILESEEKGAKSITKKQYLHLLKQIHYTQKSVIVITVLVAMPFKGPFMSFTTLWLHAQHF